MASGFIDGSFQRDTLADIILSIENDVRVAYNNPSFSIEDNENIGQLLKMFAGRENNIWQTIEQSYNVWRRNGAEGPFLDEIFALSGVFRESATAGSGDAVVETDNTAIDSTSITAGTIFSGENDGQYALTSTTFVSSRVTAYRVVGSSVSLATYNMSVEDLSTGDVYTQSFTLAANTPAARLIFLQSLQSFLQSVNPSETNIQLDETNLVLYWGFDEAFELKGLEKTVELLCTPSLGNRYSLFECVNTETGFNPLGIDGIASISVPPTGYVSVTNISEFSSGTDVETDAAFIERARSEVDSPRSSTRTAVIAGLLANVDGIEKVKINKEVVSGIVSVTPIIIGGEISDIAEELYRTQPINNVYSGDIQHTVDTADDEQEVISFSRGVQQQLSVRVRYTTTTNTELTQSEKNLAISNLLDVSEAWQLGDKIFNFSLTSAVSAATSYGRFSSLIVETKKLSEPDSSYSSADYQAADTELPDLISTNITFVQEIA
ncbi:putative baseplate component [Vibrio phage VPMCC14]|nr:putative baseplate component [Vibrio phage VPMCC14]